MTQLNHIHIDETSSTNEYLKEILSDNNLLEGLAVVAKYQNSGKGQGENSWESECDKNLTFSLLLKPKFIEAEHMFMVSKIISLGIINYLNSLNPESIFTIKWPNDIYYNNKKLAGILIENSLWGSKLNYSIIGIGININQEVFISNAPNPISLKNIFGEEFNLNECLNAILEHINYWYNSLKNREFERINSTYLSNLYRKNGLFEYQTESE